MSWSLEIDERGPVWHARRDDDSQLVCNAIYEEQDALLIAAAPELLAAAEAAIEFLDRENMHVNKYAHDLEQAVKKAKGQ